MYNVWHTSLKETAFKDVQFIFIYFYLLYIAFPTYFSTADKGISHCFNRFPLSVIIQNIFLTNCKEICFSESNYLLLQI